MTRRLFVLGTAVLLLTACTPETQSDLADISWQVTDIWTTPGEPSTLPPQDAGRAWMAFGQQSLSGHTGCSRLQGTVAFTTGGHSASAEEADTLRIDHLEVEPAAADCPATRTHGQLTGLLQPGTEFDVHHAARYLTLTLRSDALDPPAIGLAAL